jgi:hypothetical protein
VLEQQHPTGEHNDHDDDGPTLHHLDVQRRRHDHVHVEWHDRHLGHPDTTDGHGDGVLLTLTEHQL